MKVTNLAAHRDRRDADAYRAAQARAMLRLAGFTRCGDGGWRAPEDGLGTSDADIAKRLRIAGVPNGPITPSQEDFTP